MANFQFRLKTLLRLREAVRDQRRGELAQAYEAERILQQQSNELQSQFAAMLADRRAAAIEHVNVDRLMEMQRYEMILQAQQHTLSQQQQDLRKEIDRRRDALVESDREVRVLEKLRERDELRHRQREQRIEAKELDEVGVTQYAREVNA